MKHSRGPWMTDMTGHFLPFVLDVNGKPVAEMSERSGLTNENGGDAEAEANARLIVAAPDMLEALKILLVQIGEYQDGDGAAKYHAVNIAKKAIARAEESNE